MQIFVPCTHCIEDNLENPYLFPLDQCESFAVKGKQYINCKLSELMIPVRLESLVPDVTMKDFEVIKIPFEELTIGEK
jgi:hypothetical protein